MAREGHDGGAADAVNRTDAALPYSMGRVERPAPFRFPLRLRTQPPSPLLLVDEVREVWRSEPRDHRIALVFIAVVGVTLRLMYLDQPMRADEATTYTSFVIQPWREALSLYPSPNNHLFYTLLAKLSVMVFGDAPPAIRFPAFLAGVLTIPVAYATARVLYGAVPALFAGAIVAASGVMVLYSTNARGYSIVVLAFLLLVLIGARQLERPNRKLWVAFAVIGAVGLWTIPVMLFPLGTVGLWLALSLMANGRTSELRQLFLALVLTAVLALVAYLPVISRQGIDAVTKNRFVVPSPWLDFFSQLPSRMFEVVSSWGFGLSPILSILLALCALEALRRHAVVSRFPVGIPLAAFVWCAWVLVVNHRAPFARVFLWFMPIAAALAGAGVVSVGRRFRRTTKLVDERAPVLVIGLALLAFVTIVLSSAVLRTRDTGTFRDAERATSLLRTTLRPGDVVLTDAPSTAPLEYYFARSGVPPAYLARKREDVARIGASDSVQRVVLVVDNAEGQTVEGVVGTSALRDTARFAPGALVATLPASRLFLFERRNVAAK